MLKCQRPYYYTKSSGGDNALDKLVIVKADFNTHNFSTNKDLRFQKDWIENRMKLFIRFSIQSYKCQTNQNFVALIFFDDTTEDIIQDTLAQYEKLPANVKFVKRSEKLKETMNLVYDHDCFYETRLDTDDMYHKDHIQDLYNLQPHPHTQALICQRGYMYDSKLNLLRKCFFRSPPFYSLIYNTKDYIEHFRYNTPGGHEGIINLKHEFLPGYRYVYHTHTLNTINGNWRFGSCSKEDIISDKDEVSQILKDYIGT
jgi:hypothetical protein